MKATTDLQEFRGMDSEALVAKVRDLESELMNLRFKSGSAQLEQTAQLKQIRRRIARIKTVQNQQRAQSEQETKGDNE